MKCDDIKILLDEYLDNSLPDRDRSAVNEHLRTCADCGEEIRFIKKFKKEISSLRPVRAPSDLLDRVHEKIDRGGLIKTLFYPIKIKIPIEAAGLLATAAVIVLIFNPFRSERAKFPPPETPGSEARIARDEAPGYVEKTAPRKTVQRAAGRKSEGKPADETIIAYDREPTGVAVEPPRADSGLAKKSGERLKTASARQGSMTLYLTRNIQEKSSYTADETHPAADQDLSKKEIEPEEKNISSKKDMKAERADRPMSAAITQSDEIIERAAVSLDGRIIKKTCDDTTKPCRLIIVELPARNYARFLGRVGRIWTVRKQMPAQPPAGAERLRININLQ